MTTRNKRPKKLVTAVLTSLFITNQSMMLSALATNITNIQGVDGVYNINPTAIIKDNGQYTDIGYRKYKDFTLDKGDVANLIFQYGDKDINLQKVWS